jgi:N-acetylglucosaminyldiphosphoundecaprenol N-acetyl-beta-D-mannosaminyltransferase
VNRDTVRILGIDFINATVEKVVEQLKSGGLLVVPAAPALISVQDDAEYYASLLAADIVIPDSGYMVLIWNLMNRKKIRRISGLEFLVAFFDDRDVRESSFLLVNPGAEASGVNESYLYQMVRMKGPLTSYIAPFYDRLNLVDEELLLLIEAKRPKYILVNIGGGPQEKLGAFLKKNLKYKPAIICTGAAIAFLTGQQAKIPHWADKLFLGWLFRCVENPKLYIPRYAKALKLIVLMIRNGAGTPF